MTPDLDFHPRNHIDLYRDYLVEVVREVLAEGSWREDPTRRTMHNPIERGST